MAAGVQLVLLLSLGSFQAVLPGAAPRGAVQQPSPVFADTQQGLKDFTAWVRSVLPPPKFAQPPLAICVVGAVPFTADQPPYLPKPLWESQPPLHALEPYAATFHYVEPVPGAKPPKPRTLQQAVALCRKRS